MLSLSERQMFLGALIVALAALIFIFSFFDVVGSKPFKKDLRVYAENIVEMCKDSVYVPSCYDEEIPKVMNELTFEEAFEVTRIVQDLDSSYWYCHVLGHNISAIEASKDLSKWTEVIGRCPLGMCSNGCIHGTFQERFRDAEVLSDKEVADVIPQLKTICEDSESRTFTGLERASCYHALGHLTMYITAADPIRASGMCDQIIQGGRESFDNVCYDGVFMQIFQPLEPEDFALIADIAPQTQQETIALCDTFEGGKRASCHRESWPMFEDEIQTPEGIVQFCSRNVTKRLEQICYNGVFYILTPRFDFNVDTISAFCESIPDEWRGQCYGNAASRMIETDYRLQESAVALCGRAEEAGSGEQCYKEMLLYSTYNFHTDTPEFGRFCALLPGEWSKRCLNKEGYSVRLYADE